jgi:sterol desaturase/sphingolipid hydroxylase (fatty acid hydroxylase superfamily)
MGKRDSAPTYSWVFLSQVNKWLALAFILLIIVVLIIVFIIRAVIAHDCHDYHDYYKRDIKVPGYWIHLDVGSTDKECPQP